MREVGNVTFARAIGEASPMARLRLESTLGQMPARAHASSPSPSIEVPFGMTFLRDYLPELDVVLLAGSLLVGALGVGVEGAAAPAPLDAAHVVELAAAVGQDESEGPMEGRGAAQEALQPARGRYDVRGVVPLEQDEHPEPELGKAGREQRLQVAVGALHAVHLDHACASLLGRGGTVGMGAPRVEGRLMPVRLPLVAPLVPDLLAKAHLRDVYVLVLDVSAGGALRAGEVVSRGEDVVHRLAPRQPGLHLAGQERHLAPRHVQAAPRLDKARLGLGLDHLGRVGEVPQGAGRAPLAVVADLGRPVRAPAPLALVARASPFAQEGHLLLQSGSHIPRLPQVLRRAQSVPRCGSLDVKATSRGRPPVSRTYDRPTAGFPAPALAINDSRQKMEGDTLI